MYASTTSRLYLPGYELIKMPDIEVDTLEVVEPAEQAYTMEQFASTEEDDEEPGWVEDPYSGEDTHFEVDTMEVAQPGEQADTMEQVASMEEDGSYEEPGWAEDAYSREDVPSEEHVGGDDNTEGPQSPEEKSKWLMAWFDRKNDVR